MRKSVFRGNLPRLETHSLGYPRAYSETALKQNATWAACFADHIPKKPYKMWGVGPNLWLWPLVGRCLQAETGVKVNWQADLGVEGLTFMPDDTQAELIVGGYGARILWENPSFVQTFVLILTEIPNLAASLAWRIALGTAIQWDIPTYGVYIGRHVYPIAPISRHPNTDLGSCKEYGPVVDEGHGINIKMLGGYLNPDTRKTLLKEGPKISTICQAERRESPRCNYTWTSVQEFLGSLIKHFDHTTQRAQHQVVRRMRREGIVGLHNDWLEKVLADQEQYKVDPNVRKLMAAMNINF